MTPIPMTPDRWQRVKLLFDTALAQDASNRSAYLAEASEGDLDLQREVESLLAALDTERGRFDQALALWAPAPAGQRTPADRSGQWIGRYHLVRMVGAGGMGEVYEAWRDEGDFKKRVALKMIHVGRASEGLLRRFRQERRILARLEHRNIAGLIDGGVTDDGFPFYAMEFVEGQPITTWCEERQASVADRVSLFLQVCRAVEYAHRNLVVHRDLKPTNILVADDGTVKLLDFGIAKLLEVGPDPSDPDLTAPGVLAFTPSYASPEQLQNGPVSTASDVFALGIVLYELLAGCHPFRRTGEDGDQARARVLAGQVTPPSVARPEWARTLRGDLDTIVQMALRVEVDRRYRSAEQLGEDLRRWSVGLPVSARPDTARYRIGKFVRRNRSAVAASGLAVAALAGGLVAAVTQARIAAVERDRARLEAVKAQRVTGFVEGMLRSADPRGGDREMTVREVLDVAAGKVAVELGAEPEVRAAVETSIGLTYLGIGRYDEAAKLLEAALAIRKAAGPGAVGQVAQTVHYLGRVAADRGDVPAAESLFRSSLAARRQGPAADSAEVAAILNDLGDLLQYKGDLPAAAEAHREALAIRRRLHRGDHEDIAASLNNLGVVLGQQGDYAAAEPLHQEALAMITRVKGSRHPDVAAGMSALAFVRQALHRYDGADSLYRATIALRRDVMGPDHPELARTLANHASMLFDQGKFEAAAERARQVVAFRERGLPSQHPAVGAALVTLGRALVEAGRPAEGEPALRESLALRQAALPPGHWLIASVEGALGRAVAAEGRFGAAEPILLGAYRRLLEARGPDDPRTREVKADVTALYLAWGKPAEAAKYR